MRKLNMRAGWLDASFDIVVLFKSLFALLEVIGGVALFLVPMTVLRSLLNQLAKEAPLPVLVQLFNHTAQNLTNDMTLFAVIYLLAHGLLKLVSLALLWKRVLWAYPLSLVLLSSFIGYQMAEFSKTGAWSMIALTVIDLLMMVLTLLEYKKLSGNFQNLKKSYERISQMKKTIENYNLAIVVFNIIVLVAVFVSVRFVV
ncbi:DUF2127 domain-containing protein [Lactococcus protaetiae]|uniref:DUF2127 domain-containing protein n=1 Tax=Lactococcus protaetiae TaxID=2592653 RepID=A0A514Z9V8_9LACT|nr:DUF2127 domain-containing protein [Lactococcus protaetiae]QDK71345.1 DUF2127 domain-containing protein [Lactococcus protaetiae]